MTGHEVSIFGMPINLSLYKTASKEKRQRSYYRDKHKLEYYSFFSYLSRKGAYKVECVYLAVLANYVPFLKVQAISLGSVLCTWQPRHTKTALSETCVMDLSLIAAMKKSTAVLTAALCLLLCAGGKQPLLWIWLC